jgi:hypothetical protein
MSTGFIWSGQGPMADSYDHGNDIQVPLKVGNISSSQKAISLSRRTLQLPVHNN